MILELKLAATNDLIEELLDRCEVGVIALVRPAKNDPGKENFKRKWKGDSIRVAGICGIVSLQVMDELLERERDITPEEF